MRRMEELARIIASDAPIAMRGMKHTQDRAKRQSAGMQTPHLRGRNRGFEAVHFFGITAAFVTHRELELRQRRHALRCYPYPFCNCQSQRACL
jgi:hypothetical protein